MPESHGDGRFDISQFRSVGSNVCIEPGVLVFHPENISIGDDVYVGHNTMLKGYYKNEMRIGDGAWIGSQCFLHSGGGLSIGANVGVGPGVRIITSQHEIGGQANAILHNPVSFAAVEIGDNSDLGVGAIILPGVHVGVGVQVAAGAVVTADVPDYCVVAGVPARIIRERTN